MDNKFKILIPEIFPKNEIFSGVTKRNLNIFPEKGFSISNHDYFSKTEIQMHREYLANELGFLPVQLKFQKQVHGTNIQIVTATSPNGLETDGMVTSEYGLVMNISIADCLAILIYDPIGKVIAALHSGWRGTKENIVEKGIIILKEKYLTNPADLLVYLSPCASGNNYEVGYDVAKYFPETSIRVSNDKYLFDNREQVFKQLINLGVQENKIEVSDICTIENIEYHSFRRDKSKSGRMSAFICLEQHFNI